MVLQDTRVTLTSTLDIIREGGFVYSVVSCLCLEVKRKW